VVVRRTQAEGKMRIYVTRRQAQVLDKLCEGKVNKQIAREMGVEHSTVKVHLCALLEQYGATNRTELALMACGIIPAKAA
jgi:DNA-binding NarL/FixJ family response regulator